MKSLFVWVLLSATAVCLRSQPAPSPSEPLRAKNIILLLADAGGIPTLNAASILAYNAPQKLFVQSWEHIGLSDTAPTSKWVTDSAAGMTAIVTGHKTFNGVISQAPDGKRGQTDGTKLKTILEYAEEKGLSTGVMTNVSIADATPAACYAHQNDRGNWDDIIMQVFSPRFGDGVDVLFGLGRKRIWDLASKSGRDLDATAKTAGRTILTKLEDVPAGAKRAIAILESDFDHRAAARMAIQMLSKNPKGYFLMIESDAHTDNPEAGLNRLIAFDKLIREISEIVDLKETLLVFTADHSFDFRIHGGGPEQPLLAGIEDWKAQPDDVRKQGLRLSSVRMNNSHTGEEVLVAAKGPGAQSVHGFMPNTQIFHVMMSALGWSESK
ncbi:MAG: alkaline phosphatase [Bryobacteraceae bacterium]|nr:alkaline phosphatase [Bryobacteraceae bacterium]